MWAASAEPACGQTMFLCLQSTASAELAGFNSVFTYGCVSRFSIQLQAFVQLQLS